jgi:hypothetical protein
VGRGVKFARYYKVSSFDCAKTIVLIRIVFLVMGRGRFDENCYFFYFFSGPQKRVQFAYFWPTVDIREKTVGAEGVK